MEEKKSDKGLVWLIVILIIMVLGLVGFIVYDKVFSNNVIQNGDNLTTEKLNETISELNISDETDKEFTVLHYNIENSEYELVCEEYSNDNKECFYGQLNVDDNFSINITPFTGIMYNEKVYIVEESTDFGGKFEIYDKTGKKLIEKGYVGTYCKKDATNCVYYGIRINDSKLYYIEDNDKLILKKLHLNNDLQVEEIAILDEYQLAG